MNDSVEWSLDDYPGIRSRPVAGLSGRRQPLADALTKAGIKDPMSIDWDRYEPYQPLYSGELSRLSRVEAAESFEHVMAARPERRSQLTHLLASDGVEFGTSDADVQKLNSWFDRSVEPHPEDPSRLANRWYAVVNDIALVLGDILVGRCPGLRWEMFTRGTKDIAYQKHVIVGFSKAENPKSNLDVDRLVAGHGQRIIADLPEPEDAFVRILAAAEAKA